MSTDAQGMEAEGRDACGSGPQDRQPGGEAMRPRDFPAVKEARRAATKQMEFYREMMDDPKTRAAPTGEALTDEREAFETWADDQGYPLARLDIGDGDDYRDLRTQGAWETWKARAALSTHPSAPVAPKFEAERETVQRCIDRAKQWLVDGATGEPPRTEVALLWTLAQATLDLPENAAPAVQPVAPAGWKLVPVEPTQEMLLAAVMTDVGPDDDGTHRMEPWLKQLWADMLAATPSAEAQPTPKEPEA